MTDNTSSIPVKTKTRSGRIPDTERLTDWAVSYFTKNMRINDIPYRVRFEQMIVLRNRTSIITDIMIFNHDKITGIEIKGKADDLRRLHHQLINYLYVCEYVWVVIAANHLSSIKPFLADFPQVGFIAVYGIDREKYTILQRATTRPHELKNCDYSYLRAQMYQLKYIHLGRLTRLMSLTKIGPGRGFKHDILTRLINYCRAESSASGDTSEQRYRLLKKETLDILSTTVEAKDKKGVNNEKKIPFFRFRKPR